MFNGDAWALLLAEPGYFRRSVIAFAAFASLAFFPIVVRAFVTFDAVIGESNTFFLMFSAQGLRGMFMAAITGVTTVVVVRMAGYTICAVLLIEPKVLVVIEMCAGPTLRIMALMTTFAYLLVQLVSRPSVTSLASCQCLRVQQSVIKGSGFPVILAVALSALGLGVAMCFVGGRRMAVGTALLYRGLQQLMVK
jgi:hypothetical protein